MPQPFVEFDRVTFGYDASSAPLLQDLSCRFPTGWTGVIGSNGAGKTTLLRLACGLLAPQRGHVRASGAVVYCPQRTDEPPDDLHAFLRAADEQAARLRGQLGVLPHWPRHWSVLSHGERKRAQIACALWRQPQVLAADEPTNHIDLHAARLLRAALKSFDGVGLVVSHDRALLDELCTQCLMLTPPKAVLRPGGYTRAVELAGAERDSAVHARKNAKQRFEALQREAARRAHEAAGADKKRSKRGIARRDKDARAKIDAAVVTGKDGKAGRLLSQLSGRLRQAQQALDQNRVEKQYALGIELTGEVCPRNALFHLEPGSLPLGEDRRLTFPELTMRPADRIALTGPNGAGKSTLIRHIMAHLALPAERIVYMPQELPPDTARQALRDLRRLPGDRLGPVMNYISRLGSRPDRLLESETPSPGELRKILLALGISLKPHLIVMDEPTNHLDIPARETLEHALDGFPGTLVVISHDRYFLDRICQRLLVFTGQGLEPHLGNYSDWREHRRRQAAAAKADDKPSAPARLAPSSTETTRAAKKDRERQQRRLERLVASLEEEIARVEGELGTLRTKLAADHGGDWKKLHELADREHELDGLLAKRMKDWEKASAELQAFLGETGA